MFPAAVNSRLFLFAICLLIFDFCCAYPSPYSHTSTVFPRQENQQTLPVTVVVTNRITTGVGTFTQTCNITLTPTVVNGTDMVREEKSCVLTPDNGNGDVSGALPPPSSSSTVSTESPSSTSTQPPTLTSSSDTLSSTSTDVPPNTTDLASSTITDIPPATTSIPSNATDVPSSTSVPSNTDASSSTVPPNPTATGLPPASSVSASPPVISVTLTSVSLPPPGSTGTSSTVVPSSGVPVVVIGVSSVPNPTATPQPGSTGPLPDNISSSISSLPSQSSPSPQSSPTPVGAAASVDPPGKKLEVLPIGLGVFAGVSVIALFVVGIVTYERAKHRKNFRKLKLEEAGSRMGYGAA